jgi:hypothetical protein
MNVRKYNGELIPFNPHSLKLSLTKSGASDKEVTQVYDKICEEMYDGISTRILYEKAFTYLKEFRSVYAAKYSLKKALRDLGPTGFYFEKWVCALFNNMQYQSINGQVLQGHAVTHEIDVLAVKDNECIIAECKLRNDVDAKISVTTPMYFLSRLKDVSQIEYKYFGKKRHVSNGWLVTNAYFTKDAIDFGNYYGLQMLSWDYPTGKSIKNLTDDGGLYPITCLTEITSNQKMALLNQNIILVQSLLEHENVIDTIIRNQPQKTAVLAEARELIQLT